MLTAISLVWSLLVACARALDDPILALQCQDKADFARLFYLICSNSVLCRELYSLDVPHHNNSWVYDRDFHRFQYQITQTVFFPSPDYVYNVSTTQHPVDWDGHPMTYYIWTQDWQPPITLEYIGVNSSTACSESVDISGNTTESLLLVYVSLDLMKSYRAFISNEHRCNDYNEQPLFDMASGEFHCTTLSGKSSLTDASYRQLIFYLTLLVAGFTLVFVLAAVLIGIRLLP
jgi:hypothetical protein